MMIMEEKVSLKADLFAECERMLVEKAENYREIMSSASEAAKNETKSSAGDKHETARAMLHIEQAKANTHLKETNEILRALRSIPVVLNEKKVLPGSVIITDKGCFYLAVSAGKIVLDDVEYVTISTAAPIGMKFLGRAVGTTVTINNVTYLIKEVF
jgi:transcription elongation GreA/GreB family factor